MSSTQSFFAKLGFNEHWFNERNLTDSHVGAEEKINKHVTNLLISSRDYNPKTSQSHCQAEVGEGCDRLSDWGRGEEGSCLSDSRGWGQAPTHPGPWYALPSPVRCLGRKRLEDIERAKAETTEYVLVFRVVSGVGGRWGEMRNE